jgi:hypothetical protein
MKRHFQKIFFICFLLIFGFTGKIYSQESVINNFKNINSEALTIRYTNKIEINNRGGHIQGIQYIELQGEEYVFLSGSSDTYAYYAVTKLGSTNKVISVNNLMKKPFKHSGGFQIFQNFMAVGIEDNSKKDVSKVCIYDVSNPEKPSTKPIAVIDRKGEPLRSTAGCVGICNYKNKALIAVGDWDTKHLDFYTCDFKKIGKVNFNKIGTIDTEKTTRKGWIDKKWESYQNINLFVFNDNELYLIGLGQNAKNEDIADLFRLKEESSGGFSLIKLASKTFHCKNESSFKAGAGVYLKENGKFQIYACSYHITKTTYLNYFENLNQEQ